MIAVLKRTACCHVNSEIYFGLFARVRQRHELPRISFTKGSSMAVPESIHDYLRMFAGELGERILQTYPALHSAHDTVSPRLATLLRKPFPAQAVAAMGVAKKWEQDRSAAVVAECGTGKTLISLAALHVHSDGRPFTGIVIVIATIN
jgi:hypothetical protein